MTLSRAIAVVGGFTMLSRVAGLARDILIARYLGAGLIADAFFVAFKLPNFFRRLFAEGAFNAAFVPMFSRLLEREGRTVARDFAAEIMSVLVAVLLVFCGLMQVFMPLMMFVLAPGFADDPAKFDLTVELTRLTFPYLLFISLVSLQGGILNSLNRFAEVAFTPVLLNLVMIAAMLLFARELETAGHALAWGVSIAGIVQFVWLALALRREGFALNLAWPRLTPRVREFWRLMLPGTVGAGAVQINLMIDIVIASLLPQGAVSFLYYADRINQLPIGVIGIAVGTALLPMMSRQLTAGDEQGAMNSQNRSLEAAVLFGLPAMAAFLVIAEPIVAGLYQRGAFDAAATDATALALIAYAVGIPAYVLIKVLTPGFFARQDTRTPVRIAVGTLVLHLALNLTLIWPLQHVGLALATAIAAWVNTIALAVVLHRRGHLVLDARLKSRLPRILLAVAVMVFALFLADHFGRAPMEAAVGRITALGLLILVGLVSYGAAVLATGAARTQELRRFLPGGRRRAP